MTTEYEAVYACPLLQQEGVDVVKSESESDTTTIASIKSSPLYRPPSSVCLSSSS